MKRSVGQPAVLTSCPRQHADRLARTADAASSGHGGKMPSLQCKGLRPSPNRRGSIFHYYLVYMLLTSALLSAAGLCLHAVLKADRLDAQISQHLNALRRLERTLRRDFGAATRVETSTSDALLFDYREQGLKWIITDNIIRREARTDNRLTNSDRFVFRKGTQFEFADLLPTNMVQLTISDPPAIPSNPSQSTESQTEKTIQILLRPAAFRIRADDGEHGNTAAPEPEGESS